MAGDKLGILRTSQRAPTYVLQDLTPAGLCLSTGIVASCVAWPLLPQSTALVCLLKSSWPLNRIYRQDYIRWYHHIVKPQACNSQYSVVTGPALAPSVSFVGSLCHL